MCYGVILALLQFDSSDGTYDTYRTEKKAAGYRYENTMSDVGQWWANGNVIDNERVRAGTDRKFAQEWGDFFLCQLREMLEAACRTRQVADCEFFINKRDYPHLKVRRLIQATSSSMLDGVWHLDSPLTCCVRSLLRVVR